MHQGFVRLVGQDGLAADDTRYFTVEVKPAWRVLVAAPQPAESHALFLTEALAAGPFPQARPGPVRLRRLRLRRAGQAAAGRLRRRVPVGPDAAGSGRVAEAGRFRGRRARRGDLPGPQRRCRSTRSTHRRRSSCCPASCLRQARRPDGDLWLAPRDYQHPILAAFRGQAGAVPWEAFPVFRYWELDQIAGGVGVVLPYNDGRPALLERPVGRGRALTMTTPVSDRPSQNPWNLLPVGEGWPFVILANQMAAYLVGSSEQQLNYLRRPDGRACSSTPPPAPRATCSSRRATRASPIRPTWAAASWPITATDRVGNYRLQAGGSGRRRLRLQRQLRPRPDAARPAQRSGVGRAVRPGEVPAGPHPASRSTAT